MPNKKILITGASGYLAGKLIEAFSLKVDQFELVLGARSIETLQTYPCKKVQFSIGNPLSFASALDGVDTVVHLAAMNYQDCEKDPALAQKINVEMVDTLLKEAHRQGVSQFIYASTIHVFGNPLSGVISEKNQTNPLSVYSRTHFEAEEIINSFEGMQTCVLRLSNVIGAPARKEINIWSLIANDLVRQAVVSKKLKLNTSGIQKRDFVPAIYVANGIVYCASSNDKDHSVFNLGSGISLSILEMAKLIQERYSKITGLHIEIEKPSVEAREIEQEFLYDCSKIQAVVGKTSIGQIENSIDEVIKFCIKNYGE